MENVGHCLTVLVVACCVVAYMTYAEECPAGKQKRGDICCKHVICKKNEDYRLCNHTHQEDSCIPCPPNTINQDTIDTSHLYYNEKQQPNICKEPQEICVKTKCPEEAKIVNHTECLRTGNVTCECDFNRGFCGKDPKTCKKWTGNVAELKKGIELSDDCEPRKCKLGLFKDKDGYGKCREHRECSNGEIIIANGTATTDTQCGFPNAFQSTTESTNISDVNSTDRNSSTPNVPSNRGNAGLVWIVIGVILGIIAIVIPVIIYICWHRKQRGRDNHRNGFPANSGVLGQNGQEMVTMIPNGGPAA